MKKFLFCLWAGSFTSLAVSQTTIGFWDFNSTANDATPATGTILPSSGAGTITTIGGITTTFAAGLSPNDPNTTDNSGYNTTTYPAQGTNPKTAGIQIDVNTTGLQNIAIEFQQRLSNTAANTWILQYTTDASVGAPVWVDAQVFTFTPAASGTGDTWYNRTFNLSAVTALNNNANAAFRIVSAFDPVAGQYLAAKSTSAYAAGGTSRFDLLKIQSLPSITPYTLAFLKTDKTVSESVGTAKVWLKVTNVGNTTGSVDLSLSSYSNANASDRTIVSTTIPVSDTLGVNDTIAFTININDDAIAESDEYMICKLANGVNATFAASAQHTLFIKDNDKTAPIATNQLDLTLLGSFNNGNPSSNSAEISAYDALSKRIFIANSIGSKLDIVNFSNPSAPILHNSINITPYGAINSVAVRNGVVALAIENTVDRQDSGKVVFLDTNGVLISQVTVGILPDMITFNHNGTKVYTANEAEPNDTYTNDPDGSVSVIDISAGVANITSSSVSHITFTSFNGQEATLRSQGIRIYGVSGVASKDFEPEYITISDDDTKAWVTLQENNALAELDLTNNSVIRLIPLGTKDHSIAANAIDASNTTSDVNLSTFPVKGMYLPDAISHYTVGNTIYLLTANEGDARAWTGLNEESRISAMNLDATIFPNAADLKNNMVLGRLNASTKMGDIDNDGDFDEIYVYGARSFSVWDATTATLVYDSGDDFERITSTHSSYASMFNASNGAAITKKDRSDDKGPEPEGIATGYINGHEYAFIALERIGGVMMYDITNPLAPVYVGYANNRGPDRGAEGIILIPADQSPNGKNIVILSNETSSTLTIYEINPCAAPGLAGIANNGSLTICAGDSVKLYNSNSTTTTTYQWMLNGNEVAGATDSVLYVDQAGAYSLFAYNANGCENTSSVINTQAVALPVANIMNSGALTYCAGDSVKLSDANHAAGNAYTWTLNGNAISSATDSVYYANQSGIFGFSVIDANGCKDSSLTLTTQTVNYPVISVSASGVTTFCSGDSVTFTLPQNNNYTYQWINGSTLLLNETDTTLTVNATGNYAVIVSNSGLCADTSATNTVTVNAVPTIPVISQTGLDLSTASAANYQWYFNGNTISGANTQNYTAIQNGIYAVEITDNNGCTSMSADLSINSISLKNISVVNNISVYPNPNKGNITISVSGDQKNITIELFDIMGKKLETIHSGSLLSKETINYTLPALVADGIYFIKVKGVSFEKTERIILQR